MECKAKLEFDLPEQQYDFLVACQSMDLALFVHEMKQELRARRKYPSSLDGDEKITWGDVEDFFNQELRNSHVNDLIERMR